MKSSLRAILFDFDGVIADTEGIHLSLFQKILQQEGLNLDKKNYYEKYLGLSDRSFFDTFFKENNRPLSPVKSTRLIEEKSRLLLEAIGNQDLLLPGARSFIEAVSKKYYLAIVSGALRSEIEVILKGAGLFSPFQVIVAADDVSQGKPHPEGFLTAVRLLNRDCVPASEILLAEECLAIEDSPWGIEAACQAGICCLAVETSYPAPQLARANLVIPNLSEVRMDKIEELFTDSPIVT